MYNTDNLRRICGNPSTPEWLKKPVDINGLTVVTDVRLMVLLSVVLPGVEPVKIPPNKVGIFDYLNIFREDGRGQKTTTQALRQWCEKVTWYTVCPECDGGGFNLNEPDGTGCSNCRGDGGYGDDPRPAPILRLIVDRNKLAQGLSCILLDEDVAVRVAALDRKPSDKLLVVRGDEWAILLAAMNEGHITNWLCETGQELGKGFEF